MLSLLPEHYVPHRFEALVQGVLWCINVHMLSRVTTLSKDFVTNVTLMEPLSFLCFLGLVLSAKILSQMLH